MDSAVRDTGNVQSNGPVNYFPWEEKQVAEPHEAPQVRYSAQAGLIPAHRAETGRRTASLPHPVEPKTESTAYYSAQPTPPGSGLPGTKIWAQRQRRPLIIGGAVILLVILIAATVGGVLGSRNMAAPPAGNFTAPVVSQQTLRRGSRLAATGWRGADTFKIRLFYQGGDDMVRFSTFDSAGGQNWSQPSEMALRAAPETAMAACAFIGREPAQVELYYLDQDSFLSGHYFDDATSAPLTGFANASINNFPTVLPGARLSCYMPFLVAQEASGSIRSFKWNGILGEKDPAKEWSNSVVPSLPGSGGAALALLPITPLYLDSTAFVYRGADGSLRNYDLSLDGDDSATSWSEGTLAVPVPANASIAAFTVARGSSVAQTDVNTYILFQDENGVVQVVWQDGTAGSGWLGPQTFPALAGADVGTDIACVTQTAWNDVQVRLKTINAINRCYFMSSGAIKDVMFDGSEWREMGFLPMS